jgi:hypothetical protein
MLQRMEVIEDSTSNNQAKGHYEESEWSGKVMLVSWAKIADGDPVGLHHAPKMDWLQIQEWPD